MTAKGRSRKFSSCENLVNFQKTLISFQKLKLNQNIIQNIKCPIKPISSVFIEMPISFFISFEAILKFKIDKIAQICFYYEFGRR